MVWGARGGGVGGEAREQQGAPSFCCPQCLREAWVPSGAWDRGVAWDPVPMGAPALRAAAICLSPWPCFLHPPPRGLSALTSRARRDLRAVGQGQSLPLVNPTHLLPPSKEGGSPHLPRPLGSRWMTGHLEVEQWLWGLRWAVWDPPAASPSASTVRPGSWLGLGRELTSGNWDHAPSSPSSLPWPPRHPPWGPPQQF